MILQSFSDLFFAALCCWREARGEDLQTKIGVVGVILNRKNIKWGGRETVQDVVCAPWQFSGMTAKGDPNLVKYPRAADESWQSCIEAADSVLRGGPDLSRGAVFYHDVSIPGPPLAWGPVEETARYGRLVFYRVRRES